MPTLAIPVRAPFIINLPLDDGAGADASRPIQKTGALRPARSSLWLDRALERLFRKLLDGAAGSADQRLVLTFINNLKADLEVSLGDAARVFTLHGYCQHLLHTRAGLRAGLTKEFICFPGLVSIIKEDWSWLQESKAPEFVALMRDLNLRADQETFFIDRANYYDAVDFDDSVYRARKQLDTDASLIPTYELVLIDEFQDFNKMEAAVIDLLAEKNSIVVAGDDDQALYSQLRGASWDHIRARYA